ncbi:hypothetical protein CT0861_07761 [Colletotrichum tofieldiae]|uniref:Uncharacterized protein n=1 Tax=Colletotrichum tofieldiae TaxID=708197 RepID=A0A166RY94_9PEZI|nr:hypothetical protein CT0861_07761 [Colletotrichum tofieldiae]
MDDPNRRRRQNEAPMHPTSNPRYNVQDPLQQRRTMATGSTERYNRPAPLNTSPSQPRGSMGSTGSYSTYNYQEPVAGSFNAPMAANTMHYPSGYGQDGRPAQNFGGYNAAMTMGYDNLAGATGSVYDNQAQFQRQPAAAPILPTDVSTSYFSNDPSSSTGTSNIPHAQPASATATAYQQPQMANYQTNISNVGGMPQQTSSADVSMEEQDYAATGGLEEKWMEYQSALRGVFQNVRNGVLESASQSLLDVSNWLLTQVVDLGLNLDDQNLHGDRIKLWNDFNHAWLALFQMQKDMMEPGRQLQRSQTLVTKEGLEKMGKELVRLCDGIERHGLVDYQYGVWEQQIIEILEACLDQYEANEESSGNGAAAQTGSGSHQGSR